MRKKYTLPVGNVVVFDEGKRWEGQDPMTGFVAEKKKSGEISLKLPAVKRNGVVETMCPMGSQQIL